ncbi:hypothetical protein Tdes44962_MAKER02259 [Teratosphaeria destructans]|uniref:Uncharacterized protein n=1 Tax=Teratosphaeria destructans TaxID=418781 RepID=A0A9W7SUJ3_9PEZI|nr:hypothetical protein Tdes44962_MAKER02259 [Teratosphaeria destructans]
MTATADSRSTSALSSVPLAHDDQSRDPFWHSTPRSMAAVQQAPSPQPAPLPAQQFTRGPAPASAARRPQCTHMSIIRCHTAVRHCIICGKTPSLGWLYVCQQDQDLSTGCLEFTGLNPSAQADDGQTDGDFEEHARQAESLGMSAGVIKGIRKGDYTTDQARRLIDQKRHLRATIRSTQSTHGINAASDPAPASDIIASVGATAPDRGTAVPASPQTSDLNNASDASVAASQTRKSSRGSKRQHQSCHLQVCHTCRPFFTERLPMSFERVLSGKVPAVTEDEITRLPMMNPSIVRNLGLRQEPPLPPPANQSPGYSSAMHQTDGYDDDSWSSTPTSATNSETDSDQLEFADPYPCPGPGICPLWSQDSGCAYDDGFDDGMRAQNHGFEPEPETETDRIARRRARRDLLFPPGLTSAGGSSVSLPLLATAPLTPVLHEEELFEDMLLYIKLGKTRGKAKTICAGLTEVKTRPGRLAIPLGLGFGGTDSSSSLGSEVEVDGGVALTEEAVESGVPDIVTDPE